MFVSVHHSFFSQSHLCLHKTEAAVQSRDAEKMTTDHLLTNTAEEEACPLEAGIVCSPFCDPEQDEVGVENAWMDGNIFICL